MTGLLNFLNQLALATYSRYLLGQRLIGVSRGPVRRLDWRAAGFGAHQHRKRTIQPAKHRRTFDDPLSPTCEGASDPCFRPGCQRKRKIHATNRFRKNVSLKKMSPEMKRKKKNLTKLWERRKRCKLKSLAEKNLFRSHGC